MEFWVWTELLAFDNTLPDFGIGDYLERIGKTPTGISLLLGLDFVMRHEPLAEARVLPPNVGSRNGHRTNGKSDRQEWTDLKLRDLIRELHGYGIKIIFSVFPSCNMFEGEFLAENSPEPRLGLIAPLNDGRIMGEAFVGKLAGVLADYDFDGWHAADYFSAPWVGFMHPMDCLIRAFAQKNKRLDLPDFLSENADLDDAARQRKLKYLQRFHWREWNSHLESLWLGFWQQAFDAVHGLGKFIMANSPNTKSIFGALQYMNVDYRRLAEMGLDYLLVESCSASCEIIWNNRPLLHEFCAAAAEMTAAMPNVKILTLQPVRDRVEGWDVFEHAPCRFERDLHLVNTLSVIRNGELKRCSRGSVFCLGDCVEPREWRIFHDELRASASFTAVRSGELVWLSDPRAFDDLRWDHHRFGTWSPSAQIAKLKELRSIDISVIAAPEELPHITQPLAVPNFHLLEADTRKRIIASRLPLVLTGNFTAVDIPEGAETICWHGGGELNWCCVFLNWPGQLTRSTAIEADREAIPFDETVPFHLFREPYPHLDIPERFWRTAADRLRELLGPLPLENEADGIQLFRQYAADGAVRVMLISTRDHYIPVRYRCGAGKVSVSVVGSWPKLPLESKDRLLAHNEIKKIPLMIPPHGIIVADIRPAGKAGKK